MANSLLFLVSTLFWEILLFLCLLEAPIETTKLPQSLRTVVLCGGLSSPRSCNSSDLERSWVQGHICPGFHPRLRSWGSVAAGQKRRNTGTDRLGGLEPHQHTGRTRCTRQQKTREPVCLHLILK